MSARKIIITLSSLTAACFSSMTVSAPLTAEQSLLINQLGWEQNPRWMCGGYYLDQPFPFPLTAENTEAVTVTTGGGLLSQHSTSLLEGTVTVTRSGQQMTANKAYLYRDPESGKLNAIDMIGDVHLREPNSLVVGKKGRYNFQTKSKSLIDILYRTKMNTPGNAAVKQTADIAQPLKEAPLTAWGDAYEFSQTQANVYDLTRSSYTTCSPINPAWRVKASSIHLDKNTGRGYATHARLLIKDVPVFYIPYINFPIDKQRKSGFLWPTFGVRNNWGPYLLAPFYWNMAPNYDMTITPGVLSKRGVQLSDNFRYLTNTSAGNINFSILPNDRAFLDYQRGSAINEKFIDPSQANTAVQPFEVTQAELNRLLNSSDTRKGFYWRDKSRFNEHWSSHVDFNYASDDYYLQDFGRTLNELSANQLLQEGDVNYQSEHWNFIGRLQAYQTLHPIEDNPVLNQYRRFPQLILNADYPDQKFGLQYFITNEVAHFDIRKTPGTNTLLPIGNRMHMQPGISLPLFWPSFYINPRLQYAVTDYDLQQIADTNAPSNKRRSIPIFDIASGIALERNASIFKYTYKQTLEPQVYYTYIPYRNQASIPVFDTTVNTLTYDQLFNYNRFTGLDRIGDANQISAGITSRFIDQETGLEKVRLGVGEIIYFQNRRVTLCNTTNPNCNDTPDNPNNKRRLSPISAFLGYHVNDAWSFNVDSIWNPITKQLGNATVAFQYRPDELHLVNIGYRYARNGDILNGVATDTSADNLKVTDLSVAWPLTQQVKAVGRWSENWNHVHLQNLLFGLQYDTCCWAVRAVGGRAFTGFDSQNNNQPTYNNEGFIEFSLKGLGDAAAGNTGLLTGIPGYKSQFGQEV